MDVINDQNIQRKLSMINKEEYIFGFICLCDGYTISRIPLFNILVSIKDITDAVLEIVYCQRNLAKDKKKQKKGTFICNIFPSTKYKP